MWQPIETAPRDATAILVMRDIWPGARSGRAEECNGRNTYVAAWWPDERGGQGAWICYMDAALDPECPVEPTHWMPLPDAPGAQPAPSVPEDVMRDAERYRYLRARDAGTAGVGCWIEAEGRVCDRGWLYGVQLDSAIDSFIEMLAAAPEAKP